MCNQIANQATHQKSCILLYIWKSTTTTSTLRRYFDCPYICFGYLKRVIDTPAGFPHFMYLPIVGHWSTGSPSPSICRTAPTCLPVLIQTWVTVSLAVLLISVSQGTTASLRCISN